jgi:hypothetical protein
MYRPRRSTMAHRRPPARSRDSSGLRPQFTVNSDQFGNMRLPGATHSENACCIFGARSRPSILAFKVPVDGGGRVSDSLRDGAERKAFISLMERIGAGCGNGQGAYFGSVSFADGESVDEVFRTSACSIHRLRPASLPRMRFLIDSEPCASRLRRLAAGCGFCP